jgi:HK97 family phage major capsid protein
MTEISREVAAARQEWRDAVDELDRLTAKIETVGTPDTLARAAKQTARCDALRARVQQVEAQEQHQRQRLTEARLLTAGTRNEDSARIEALNRGGDAEGVDRGERPVLGPERRMADWVRGRIRSNYSAEEIAEFSLGRMVRGMVTGNWKDAEVERRALAEGTLSAGGALTPEVLAGPAIDRVRNAARVFEAGAQTVPLESDQHSIPRLATGVTGAWRNENTAVIEQDATFERVTFTARTLAVLTRISYELLEDMTPESAQLVEDELTRALSLELDRVALRGSGTAPEPGGIRNQAGVEIQSMGTNGATPSNWDTLVNAVAGVQADNIEPNAAIYSSRTAKGFALFKDTTGQPLAQPRILDGVRPLVTNQIPNTLVQGTSSDTSEIYVGDFRQLLVGLRPAIGVQVQRLTERFADNMQVGLLAWLRGDIQLQHPEAFVVVTGVRP